MKPDFRTAKINKAIIHFIGNAIEGEKLATNNELLNIENEDLQDYLLYLFQSLIKSPDQLEFDDQLQNTDSVNFHFAQYFDKKDFMEFSVKTAERLYATTRRYDVTSGDLIMIEAEGVEIGTLPFNCIGLIKIDSRQPFLKCNINKNKFNVDLDNGITTQTIEKGALIMYGEAAEIPRIYVEDKDFFKNKDSYWSTGFLEAKIKTESYQFTKNIMSIAKDFVATEMETFEVPIERTEKIDLLNKTAEYFKNNEIYEEKEFVERVFSETPWADKFVEYKEEKFKEQNIEEPEKFRIDETAVKKQQRIFKSVLKLDKNFHIYIHGDRKLIEKGFDEEKGKKFYKVYYEHED